MLTSLQTHLSVLCVYQTFSLSYIRSFSVRLCSTCVSTHLFWTLSEFWILPSPLCFWIVALTFWPLLWLGLEWFSLLTVGFSVRVLSHYPNLDRLIHPKECTPKHEECMMQRTVFSTLHWGNRAMNHEDWDPFTPDYFPISHLFYTS